MFSGLPNGKNADIFIYNIADSVQKHTILEFSNNAYMSQQKMHTFSYYVYVCMYYSQVQNLPLEAMFSGLPNGKNADVFT